MAEKNPQAGSLSHTQKGEVEEGLEIVRSSPSVARHLQSQTLVKIVKKVGVEPFADLLPYLTRRQTRELFDEVLWEPDPTKKIDTLSYDEAVCWLKSWVEVGDEYISKMIPDQGQTFFSALISLFADIQHVSNAAYSLIDVESGHRSLGDVVASLELVFGEYVLVAKIEDNETWEAFSHFVNVLWETQPEFLLAALASSLRGAADVRGKRRASLSEELRVDAASEREERRAEIGFLTTEKAREAWHAHLAQRPIEHIKKLLFLDDASVRHAQTHVEEALRRRNTKKHEHVKTERPASELKLAEMVEAKVMSASFQTSRSAHSQLGAGQGLRIEGVLKAVALSRPELAGKLQRELAALSNMMVLGVTVLERNIPVEDASRAVLSIVALGLGALEGAESELIENGVLPAFSKGVACLHTEVAREAALILDKTLQGRESHTLALRKSYFDQALKSGLKPKSFSQLVTELRFAEIRKILKGCEVSLDATIYFSLCCYLQELPVRPASPMGLVNYQQKWMFIESREQLEDVKEIVHFLS